MTVERPAYDLTIFKLHCGKLTLKIYSKVVLERFANALSCIDQCFIADDMLEQLPTASRVGKTIVVGLQPRT